MPSPAQGLSLASQFLNVGIIGCGNYARGGLIPKIREIHGINIKGICTATSVSARSIADKLKCNYCTTHYKEILSDEDTHAVFIATRHNTHAEIVIDALKAGKHVFVEKPLATTEEELKEIKRVLRKNGYLLASIPNDLSLFNRIRTVFGISYQHKTYKRFGYFKHHTFFSLRLFKFMLRKVNLKILKTKKITNLNIYLRIPKKISGKLIPLLFTNTI